MYLVFKIKRTAYSLSASNSFFLLLLLSTIIFRRQVTHDWLEVANCTGAQSRCSAKKCAVTSKTLKTKYPSVTETISSEIKCYPYFRLILLCRNTSTSISLFFVKRIPISCTATCHQKKTHLYTHMFFQILSLCYL
jgi:hypothetical protein